MTRTTRTYDAIVVGGRCAGSPVAMLLARKGYRVLLVDRATFPSDTLSTHVMHPPAVACMARWGLLDALKATGCPPIDTYAFDFGSFCIAGSPGTVEAPFAFCPRRTILDKLLLDAAKEAGAEVREGFTVDRILFENERVVGITGRSKDGKPISERATVVIGADGRNSTVAKEVRAEQYNEKPPLLAGYYSYWSSLPMAGRFEMYDRPYRGIGAAPTHDDLTMVVALWSHAEFEANKKDIEGCFSKTIDLAPEFAERMREARREARFAGSAVSNYFRKPFGPGWALAGDAAYNKDFITAQGINDAFRDAELCSHALDEFFAGAALDDAMSKYQRARDEAALPMYEYTCETAMLQPPTPETRQLLMAIHGNQATMDDFARMNAGTISPGEFLAPDNIDAIMASVE
jgi:2-polyprenyl-6-methoxyphenol hydroxylase-like FAD-dependent oxidoreductase